MKWFWSFLAVLLWVAMDAQSVLVINELQAANRLTYADPEGLTPDWIEVYNTTGDPQDMKGMRLAVAGRQHIISSSLVIPANTLQLLWLDGHPERGNDHIGFSLPRKGGSLLLIAADGSTIMDLFTYPAMVGDLSVGRLADGTQEWTFFRKPTPGSPNGSNEAIHQQSPAPTVDAALSTSGAKRTLALNCTHCGSIQYTLDGTEPTEEHGNLYSGPFPLPADVVIRARAFRPDQLPSKELCLTLINGSVPQDGITVALDQRGLWGDSTGINVEGALANFSRRGRPWERLAMVQFNGATEAPIPLGISVHGSGSRSLAKRSFKLHARDRYDSPVEGIPLSSTEFFNEGILRADAGPHNFLRNLFIETVIQRYNLAVAVQPSEVLPLYLNGEYWGLYRWMPPKDAQWLKRISGAESVDVLEGPSAVVKTGSDAHFKKAQRALLSIAPLDSIESMIDMQSLIDLACLDLYTGRADHDLNVRCYRPRQKGGKWRWVVYDMDLWAPANENTVQRMGLGSVGETPYLPLLLQQPELQERFLARFTALQSTAFDPGNARATVDELYHTHEKGLLLDHERWKLEMPRPDPPTCLQELERYVVERPISMFKHLSAHTGRKLHIAVIIAPPEELGVLILEGIPLPPGKHEVRCFQGIRMDLEAIPADGVSFTGWKGREEGSPLLHLELAKQRTVQPLFAKELP